MRTGRLTLALLLAAVVCPAVAQAGVVSIDGISPASCPDPSVVKGGAYDYLVCTSDYDPNAFPIYRSNDPGLDSWHSIGSVFPAGQQPGWALPAGLGRYWAPDINRIGQNWVVYFAAQAGANTGLPVSPGTFVIGVAWSPSLSGPWHTRIIHYRGQFNRWSDTHENYGGVIDPGEVQDPRTGQRYLFWSEQPGSMWSAPLSADGLSITGHQAHMVLHVQSQWDCEASACVTEGSAPFYYHGLFYLFYSVRSTWDSSYAMRVGISQYPLIYFHPQPGYILRAGYGWLGPGGGQAPIQAPNGRWLEFYHASRTPNYTHDSAQRYLLSGTVRWHNVTFTKRVWRKHKWHHIHQIIPLPLINRDGVAG